ncbi:ADYC domain-containing protein [Archangium primigenium]|uniref:ADYC domain-containing protein n=1 Tax=[Archangium] primigenium TaxID=2792470 RepID=UPI00195AAC57|nr:ADYC domain-containing protein [Archangium primigenium]MBM7112020.1 hypothetical protein [Archangium primigenium]
MSTPSSRPVSPLCLVACLGLLLACQGELPPPETTASPASRSFAQDGDPVPPGWPTQGRLLHGSALESVSFLSADFSATKKALHDLHLERGELVGAVDYERDTTHPVLAACAQPTVGATRDCGYGWRGVGACTPGTLVSLGAGGCGLGTCSGDPVLRVCPGPQSCTQAQALVSGDNGCGGSLCPHVTFVCPASGRYTVLAGPKHSGTPAWSVGLVPSSGVFPARREVRGTELIGARLHAYSVHNPQTPDMLVSIEDVINADTVDPDVQPTSGPARWDASGATFLYKTRLTRLGLPEKCERGSNPDGSNWMVPLFGTYDEDTGVRDGNPPARFTFGCTQDVIAKCYRWGYQPWKGYTNASSPAGGTTGNHGQAHAVCTRMARADYCGNGGTQTQEGTPILFWDEQVSPANLARPTPSVIPAEAPFEAGWNTLGAVCLSHARWKTLPPPPTQCQLIAPSLLADGSIAGDCAPGQVWVGPSSPNTLCPTVCNTPEEALNYSNYNNPLLLFNHSALHGEDAGTP